MFNFFLDQMISNDNDFDNTKTQDVSSNKKVSKKGIKII
jgi:hypothetical protein